jgi:glycolate oxidase FAD binding subunit
MNSEHRYSATAFSPSTSEELRAFLVENFGAAKRPLIAVGGGTSFELETHGAERRLKVATRGLDRVVEFAARDMTITVEAGIPIARLDEVLRSEGLRLPIDIPQWDRATLGGAVAADASGPRRYGLGTFRDYVIGLAAMKADGQVFHSGGRVVKNVAGYDLCKLMVGSRGTLAILTQITLKLKPIPEASALVCAAFANVIDREAAVAGLLQSKTRPVALDSLNRAAIQGLESRLQLGIPATKARSERPTGRSSRCSTSWPCPDRSGCMPSATPTRRRCGMRLPNSPCRRATFPRSRSGCCRRRSRRLRRAATI